MAIAFDAKTAAATNNPGPLTFSHTCTGSNLVLFVSATANGPSETTTAVTYNSVGMTKVGAVRDSAGPEQSLWYLFNPSTGTNTVSITVSGSAVAGSSVSFTGADSSGLDASGTGTETTTTSFSASLTTVADNSWVVMTSRCGGAAALTAGANTTVDNQPEATFFGGGAIWHGGPKTPAGSFTLNVTSSSQLFGGAIMASIKPVASGTTAFPKLALMGVGR